MHLWCHFYLSKPTFAKESLDCLQATIRRILPQWSSQLQVAKDEDSRQRINVRPHDPLHDCLLRAAPPKRGLGSTMLFGADPDLLIFLDHSDRTFPSELNMMSVEIYEIPTVEGRSPSVWARGAFEAVSTSMELRYANARADKEYYVKNMIDDETGVSAIGASIADATPGLYWLNFFGRPYVDLIGRERLLSAPAYEVKPVGDGVLIALDESAENWHTPEYREREQAVIQHLGPQYFFSRHDPQRKTIAPDFRAYL